MSNTNIAFKGNLIIRGKIECLTGLHIGGSKEKMEIGGVDSIVVRSPQSDFPYIPGSSLKGKMRHLLEYINAFVNQPLDGELGNVSVHPEVVRVFGIGADVKEQARGKREFEKKHNEEYKQTIRDLKDIGLSRLTVRDAMPDEETVEMWDSLGSDLHYTEYKAENTLDRLTSAANPRFIERVVEGSKFDFEMVYTAYSYDDNFAEQAQNDVKNILTALRLLEASALGKSGSRGYGKIAFHLADPVWVLAEDYIEGSDKWETSKKALSGLSLHQLEAIDSTKFNFPADAV
jgi:CRISPR-associated protein Csm3